MYLRMQRHASRADSASHQFMMRVPRDVVARVQGRVVTVELPAGGRDQKAIVSFQLGRFAKLSLSTRDAETADTRRLAVVAELSKVYGAARTGTVALSQKQTVALAGEVHHFLLASHDDNPGTPDEWAAWKAFTRAASEGRLAGVPPIEPGKHSEEQAAACVIFGSDLTAGVDALPRSNDMQGLVQRCGRLALWVLQRQGIEVDRPSHVALLREIAQAALQAGWQLKRQSSGDYRPDPLASRFPAVEKASKGATLSGVFQKWQIEAKPAASTVTTWRGVVASFTAHLGHDDLSRVRDQDVIAWKDRLLEEGKRPKSINDSHLACLKALLNYAKRNRLIAANPADGVRVNARKQAGQRMLGYDDAEVSRLLSIASRETAPARRWLPWLAVLTGARIGELAQAWGSQVREIDGVWTLKIEPSPDGGSLKNEGSERKVPLHPALIEAGFVAFAQACGHKPMFYGRPARLGATGRHPSKGTSNHLATWIREQGFTDPRKAPSHAARHWFKSAASRAGIADSIADHLQGHAGGSDAATYRHFEMRALADAVSRIGLPTRWRDLLATA